MRVVADALLNADAATAEAALPIRDTPLHDALGVIASLADQPQLRVLCLGTVALGLVSDDTRLARTGLRMLAAHELATLAKTLVKAAVVRRRPRSTEDTAEDAAPELGHDTSKEQSSFPSGHAGGATAVARAFARAYPDQRPAAYGAAAIGALVQVPRCAHYPTDIGAGVLIGLAAEAASDALLSRLPRSARAD